METLFRSQCMMVVFLPYNRNIAELVYQALPDEKSHNTDHLIVGPDVYTHDEVVAISAKSLNANNRISYFVLMRLGKQKIESPTRAASLNLPNRACPSDRETRGSISGKREAYRNLLCNSWLHLSIRLRKVASKVHTENH
ncbi:hypothetical protein H2248_011653 [Termitomyces sp. 'cryptogamus']|nr:hypothetical protein H2248_011653 [Termitomyces sp. 'cryptogamus']